MLHASSAVGLAALLVVLTSFGTAQPVPLDAVPANAAPGQAAPGPEDADMDKNRQEEASDGEQDPEEETTEKADASAEDEEEKEELDPTIRPLQYFKDAFVESCCGPLWMKDVQLTGYLDQTFTYNLNQPDDPRYNSLRSYDRKHGSYMLNMLQLYAVKDPTPESRWGFASRVSTGWDADLNSPFEEDNTDKFDWQEIYGSYLFDLGENGLLVKAGRMATLAGAEVIEQKDNWNISRSFLYGYAIPITHTGLRASYKINDMYDFTFGVNRGWDTFRYDNNESLSYEARLGATCSDKLSLATVFIAGPEQEGNDRNVRRLIDFVATYKFSDKLTGMLNVDVAREEGAAPDGGDAAWRGVAAYLKYDCTEKLSYAWRGEVFSDREGARTGTDQTLIGNTLTAQYKFRENLWGRLEFRHDRSNGRVFASGSDGLSRGQNTVAASVVITF